jgi:hypothetical protein
MFAKPGDANNFMEQLPIIRDGLCYVNGGHELTCMFHHYTRDPKLEKQIREQIHNRYELLPK